jgi:hypothetical protein
MRFSNPFSTRIATLALALGAAPIAVAQQAIITPAATQPGAGRFTIREVARYISLDDDPTPLNRSGDEFRMTTEIAVGITGSLSLEGEIPIAYRDIDGAPGSSIDGVGFPDFTVRAKWRVWKEDFGPLDTGRLSLFGGLKIRSGDSDFTSDSYDPIFGAVYTQITGRHGFNLAAQYRLTTGSTTRRRCSPATARPTSFVETRRISTASRPRHSPSHRMTRGTP